MIGIDWNQARAFAATAAAGSLSAAARRLGLTQPTLSRQVAALEASLGIALFERAGKRLVLTEAGRGLADRAGAMASAADGLALAAAGRAGTLGGRVTVSASDVVAAYLLPEIAGRIRRRAPEITLAVVASNAVSDLRRREADIAIRHVRPVEPGLVARLVRETTAHAYAAEAWTARHGNPRTAAALAAALASGGLVGFEPVERFARHLRAAGVPVAADGFRLVSENSVVLWEMVRRGLGAGIMLRDIGERTPGVVRLAAAWPGTKVPIWLVTHRELRTSRRVRLVFDILAEELARGAVPAARRR